MKNKKGTDHHHIASLNDFKDWCKSLAKDLNTPQIIYLKGEMGVGKTTLVSEVLKAKGFSGQVSSPTFALVNQYDADIPVIHMDLYRLDGNNIPHIDLDLYLSKKALIFIEWAEKLDPFGLPESAQVAMEIEISYPEKTSLEITEERQIKVTR